MWTRVLSNNAKASVTISCCLEACIFALLSTATRKEEVAGIRSKFPNSRCLSASIVHLIRIMSILHSEIPVIVERYHKEKDLPVLGNVPSFASVFHISVASSFLVDKTKFLVPQELTMSQFVTIIRYVDRSDFDARHPRSLPSQQSHAIECESSVLPFGQQQEHCVHVDFHGRNLS